MTTTLNISGLTSVNIIDGTGGKFPNPVSLGLNSKVIITPIPTYGTGEELLDYLKSSKKIVLNIPFLVEKPVTLALHRNTEYFNGTTAPAHEAACVKCQISSMAMYLRMASFDITKEVQEHHPYGYTIKIVYNQTGNKCSIYSPQSVNYEIKYANYDIEIKKHQPRETVNLRDKTIIEVKEIRNNPTIHETELNVNQHILSTKNALNPINLSAVYKPKTDITSTLLDDWCFSYEYLFDQETTYESAVNFIFLTDYQGNIETFYPVVNNEGEVTHYTNYNQSELKRVDYVYTLKRKYEEIEFRLTPVFARETKRALIMSIRKYRREISFTYYHEVLTKIYSFPYTVLVTKTNNGVKFVCPELKKEVIISKESNKTTIQHKEQAITNKIQIHTADGRVTLVDDPICSDRCLIIYDQNQNITELETALSNNVRDKILFEYQTEATTVTRNRVTYKKYYNSIGMLQFITNQQNIITMYKGAEVITYPGLAGNKLFNSQIPNGYTLSQGTTCTTTYLANHKKPSLLFQGTAIEAKIELGTSYLGSRNDITLWIKPLSEGTVHIELSYQYNKGFKGTTTKELSVSIDELEKHTIDLNITDCTKMEIKIMSTCTSFIMHDLVFGEHIATTNHIYDGFFSNVVGSLPKKQINTNTAILIVSHQDHPLRNQVSSIRLTPIAEDDVYIEEPLSAELRRNQLILTSFWIKGIKPGEYLSYDITFGRGSLNRVMTFYHQNIIMGWNLVTAVTRVPFECGGLELMITFKASDYVYLTGFQVLTDFGYQVYSSLITNIEENETLKETTLNERGLIGSLNDGLGNVMNYVYDTHGNIYTEQLTQRNQIKSRCRYTYDELNNITRIIDEGDNTTSMFYSSDFPTKVSKIESTDLEISKEYFPDGKLKKKSVTDKDGITYDISYIYPTGFISIATTPHGDKYEYSLISKTEKVKYNNLLIHSNQELADGSASIKNSENGEGIYYIINKDQQLADIRSHSGSMIYIHKYDTSLRLLSVTDNNRNRSKRYNYDDNKLISLTDEDIRHDFLYDGDNLTNRLQDKSIMYSYSNEISHGIINYFKYLTSIMQADYAAADYSKGSYGMEMIRSVLVDKVYQQAFNMNITTLSAITSILEYDLNTANNTKKTSLMPDVYFDQVGWIDGYNTNRIINIWVRVTHNTAVPLIMLKFGNQNITLALTDASIMLTGVITLNMPFAHAKGWHLYTLRLSKKLEIYIDGKALISRNLSVFRFDELARLIIYGRAEVAYIGSGLGEGITAYEIAYFYLKGERYFSNIKITNRDSVSYYNYKTFSDGILIPLRGSLITSNNKSPLECNGYTDSVLLPSKYFVMDDLVNRWVYKSNQNSLLTYELGLAESFTISMWIRPKDNGNNQTLMTLYTKDYCMFHFVINSERRIQATHLFGGCSLMSSVIPNDEWTHISYTYSADDAVRIYINGELDASRSFDEFQGLTMYSVSIGYDITRDSASSNFQGHLEMFSFRASALSNTEIEGLYDLSIISKKSFHNIYNEIEREELAIVSDNVLKRSFSREEQFNDEGFSISRYIASEVNYIGEIISYKYNSNQFVTEMINGDYTYQYEYDSFGKIISEACKKKTVPPKGDPVNRQVYKIEYTYDLAGNLLSATRAKLPPIIDITCTYSSGDRLESVRKNKATHSIVWGGDGSKPTSYRGYEFIWEINRLIEVENSDLIAEYSYDESDIRIKKTVNGVATIIGLLGSVVVSESCGNNVTYYHHDGNNMLIGFNYNGKEYFYLRDLIGNIYAIIDSKGKKVVQYRYTAYGRVESEEVLDDGFDPKCQSYLYKGYYYDRETGLYYLNSRYYDPEVGRFISADDVSYLDMGSIHGLNLYAYCGNNPIMGYDPSGNFPLLTVAIIAGIMLFTPVGGIVTQTVVSTASYIGMTVWAVGDLFSNDGQGAWADMCAINWNPFNTDEEAVLASGQISFYKGMPVFMKNGGRSGSFYFISLNKDTASADTVRHEWGHGVQAMIMGPGNYGLTVGIMSPFSMRASKWGDYYNSPWEAGADYFGGVQGRTHTKAEISRAMWYLAVGTVFFPAAYFFLI